jgi:hypothetical protein
LAEQPLHPIGRLYQVERKARDVSEPDLRLIRQEKPAPTIETLHKWMPAWITQGNFGRRV